MTTIRVDVRGGEPTYLGPQVGDGRYALEPRDGGAWLLTPVPADPFPYRMVDRGGRGWLIGQPPADGEDQAYSVFPRLDREPGVETWTYSRILAERGPVRPISSMAPRADRDRLVGLLSYAGTKAVGTLLFALHILRGECARIDGDPHRMVAGRPGSWESSDLLRLGFLACVPSSETDLRQAVILDDEYKAAAAAGAVVDPDNPNNKPDSVVVEAYKVLHGWVFGADVFVETAANIAGVFGRVVDGRGGWDQVTTSWTRQGELGATAKKLLCAASRYHGSEAR